MKGWVKRMVLISLCTVFTFAFGFPGDARSAAKGTLKVATNLDATTLDPHDHLEVPAMVVNNNLFDCLVKRIYKDGKLQHEPHLATSWERLNETTWIFYLRKGVKFHNGEPFNAEAVKFNIDRLLSPSPKMKRGIYFNTIDRVEIIDPSTVKIITKVPSGVLFTNIGYTLPFVAPKYTKEKGNEYAATHPVGTGPFKFVRWKKDDEMVFEANEEYWDGPPSIKTLIFKPIPEDATRVAALVSGDVDIAKNIPVDLIQMVKQSKRCNVLTAPSPLTINVFFDTLEKGSPLQDKRVRQGINYAVDKESIIKTILMGYGEAVGSPLNRAHIGYSPKIKPYPYDPEKAKALLREAGYGSGFNTTLNIPSGRYQKDKEVAEAIAGHLSKVGINVKVQVWEWGSYNQIQFSDKGAGPLWMIGWASSFDADAVISPNISCTEKRSKYCNKELDDLMARGRSTVDIKERERIYEKVAMLLHEEAAGLWLHIGYDTYGVNNRIQNWEPTSDESRALIMHRATIKD